jgi:F-type H+-transporting ATPase subunit a
MLVEATIAVSDSTQHAGHEENVGQAIIAHVSNSSEWHLPFLHLHLPHFPPVNLFGIEIDLSISNHVIMMWIASLLLLFIFTQLYDRRRKVPSGITALLETLILFVRDEIAIPNMGRETGRRLTPLILSFFFFILTMNLMGLIPLFTTATANISVTAGLALVSFFVMIAQGMRENGVFGYLKSLVPQGIPVVFAPLMFLVEFIGLFTKPFALAVRLFANMTAGHVVILSFISLIIVFKTVLMSPISVAFALFINVLEILVAFIQAYIFSLLSAMFIGMAAHPSH